MEVEDCQAVAPLLHASDGVEIVATVQAQAGQSREEG